MLSALIQRLFNH